MTGAYVAVTKPRMVMGNAIVAAAAFIFGSPATCSWPAFALTCAGLWLVMSSACALNNYYDRGIDSLMARTKGRALAMGALPSERVLALAAALLIIGSALINLASPLAMWLALGGWACYALFYTPLKHRSGLALYVGAVAGAIPPVVGYVAAAGRLDMWAGFLFAALYLWQLPHFIAIAYYRFDEYAAAGVPMLVGRPTEQTRARARRVFYASLVALLVFSALLILQRWIR